MNNVEMTPKVKISDTMNIKIFRLNRINNGNVITPHIQPLIIHTIYYVGHDMIIIMHIVQL